VSRSVLLVAGEVSGDMHAAAVVRAVRRRDPAVQFFGIGGDVLAEAGMDLIHHVREMAVFGLPEVLRRYGFFKRVFAEMVELARARRPDAALLVDYGGFNIRYAQQLHALGVKVLYYICPQVWASRKSRMQRMAAHVDRLLVIFPFEKELFAGTDLRVDFVGHPLVEEADRVRKSAPAELPWQHDTRVAILPGSRQQEVERILPTMCAAGVLLEQRVGTVSFLVASPNQGIMNMASAIAERLNEKPKSLKWVTGKTREALYTARAAMVASGTATVEAALMGCPMVVVYKTSWPIYLLARRLVRIPYIGMVNVVAKRMVCPEFIQSEATPVALATAMEALVQETPERRAMVQNLADVSAKLGEGGAVERAADIVMEELRAG